MSDEIYLDQPTGLYNRRYLDEALPQSIHAWIKDEEAFTLVMVDLDHFKTVNDQYGHARGDAVLKSFARFLRESTRTTDRIIRYGGDEFLCVLPSMQRMNAELLYNRILEKCHNTEFDGLKMTISVGLASFPADGMDYQKLFAIADASLYEAKRGGRNRLGTVQKKQINIPIKAFINRREELNTLLHKVTNNIDSLRVIVINGNVGVGKSRLTRECLNLTKGHEIIWADCLLFSENIAYYAIRELAKYRMQRRGPTVFDELPLIYRLELGKLAPEVLETIRDKFDNLDLVVDRYRLYESVRKSFEIGEQTKVVIIDNFQWIDRESLEILRYLFRSMKDTSSVFILLNRVEEMTAPLLDFLADVSREVLVNEIELAPLPASQIQECVRAIIGDEPQDRLTEYAFQSSGGNPYFLEELFRGLAAGEYLTLKNDQWQFRVPNVEIVPKSVELIAQRKYKLLSIEAQRIMQFASIIGHFDFNMLGHLTGYGESELRGLLAYISRSGIMRELRGKLVFVDEFSRRAIYRKFVTGLAAHGLHRQVAERLETAHRGRETDVLDELASNYYYAADKVKGLEYCLLAGQRAQQKYANADAIRYYSWAEELLAKETGMEAKRYAIVKAREAVYNLQGEREVQQSDLETMKELAEALNDDQLRGEVALRQADYAMLIGDYPMSITAIEEAINLAQIVQDTSLETESYKQWGRILWNQGNFILANKKFEWALTLARAARLKKAEADNLLFLGILALYQGNYVEAIDFLKQTLNIVRELHNRQGEIDTLNSLGILDTRLGNYSEGQTCFEQALQISRAIGNRMDESMLLDSLALLTHQMGDNETAQGYCQQALLIAREVNDPRMQAYALTTLGHALLGLGQSEQAIDSYQEAVTLRHTLGQQGLAIESLAGVAHTCLAQGSLTQAQGHVNEILEFLKNNTLNGTEGPFLIYLTCYRVLRACQDPRTQELLHTMYHKLQEQAAKITNNELKQSFLKNVAAHRDIVEEYSKNHNNPSQK